jgi:hypothetical protein
MNRNDRDALRRAMEICRAESPGRSRQLDAKLKDEPWEEVAKFAAHCCQSRALRLFPWQDPPMYGAVDISWRDEDAARLLHQMLSLGVSKYEPDPMAAIEAAKQRKKAPA